MATELGVAYLSIIPETSKIAPGIKKALGDSGASSEADKSGKSLGKRFSGALGKVVKTGGVATATAAVATLGTALYKGFSRLQGLEQARAKLTGLGHSAASVEKIMGNALAAVKGTAFGMDEAATTAAGAVAAGVKPGKDLEKTLTLVGDAATIAGTGMGEMGAIFNKVAASNKIQGEVIAQLNDAGIPIVQLLGKELGTTAEETLKLASQGKVNFETFQKAMESGLGGAAQESGKTVSGAFANMQAALGRLGASALGGVFAKLPQVFGNVTASLDKLGPAATKIGESAGAAFARFGQAVSRIDWDTIAKAISGLGKSLVSAGKTVAPALAKIVKALAPLVGAALVGAIAALSGAFDALGPTIEGIASAFASFVDVIPIEIIQIAAVAVGAYTAVILANATAQAAITVATKAWAIAQRLLNVAMRANPIGLVVAALAALAAGLVMAYKKSETFRKIVIAVFNAIKATITAVFDGIKAYFTITFEVYKKIFTTAWNVIKKVTSGAFDGIKRVVTGGVGGVVSAIASVPGKLLGFGGKFLRAGTSLMRDFFRGFKAAASAVGGFIGNLAADIWGGIKGFINSMIDKIEDAISFKIDWPGPGSFSFNPSLPHLARGTTYHQGGLAVVGEQGPELVNLPRGSRVYTASQTRQRIADIEPLKRTEGRGMTEADVLSLLERIRLDVTVGADRQTKAAWYLEGQGAVAQRA